MKLKLHLQLRFYSIKIRSMINLLPPEQKKELLLEEKLKMVLILGIIISAFLISLILILLSIKISILAEREIQQINLGQKEIEEKIQKANLIFSQLESFYQGQKDLIIIFEKIFNTLPSGSYLTNLSFDSAASQMALAGFSPTREILLELKENLEKEGSFFEVNFPPTNWLEPNNINFSLTFKIK